MSSIGTLRETHLHAALKRLYARPDDEIETPVQGFVADVRRGDLLIEIQTGSFAALKRKLPALLDHYQILLVHPIAAESWILKEDADGQRLERRKSPRRGQWWDVFTELVSVPGVLAHPNFALEVLLVREEQRRRPAPAPQRRRRWRPRAWRIVDRHLLEVVDRRLLQGDEAYRALIPPGLPQPFTSRELAETLALPGWLTHKVVYVLRHMGVLEASGKRGRAFLWQSTAIPEAPIRATGGPGSRATDSPWQASATASRSFGPPGLRSLGFGRSASVARAVKMRSASHTAVTPPSRLCHRPETGVSDR